MKLLEILNSAYPYKKEWESDTDVDYYFRADNEDTDTPVEVHFQLKDEEHDVWLIVFERNREWDVTGGGDAFKIFSTVLKIVDNFTALKKPDYLMFSSKSGETSRRKLYDVLVNKAKGYSKVNSKKDPISGFAARYRAKYPNNKWYILARN